MDWLTVLCLISILLPAPLTAQAFFNFPAGSSQVSKESSPDAGSSRRPQPEVGGSAAGSGGGSGRRVQTIQALRDLMAELASRTQKAEDVIYADSVNEATLNVPAFSGLSQENDDRQLTPSARVSTAVGSPEVEVGPRGSGIRGPPPRDRTQVYAPELDPANVQKRPRLRLPETESSETVLPVAGQAPSLQEFIPTCPDSSFSYIIPSPVQCDLYYLCEFGKASRRLCEDGLVFSLEQVKCVAPELENCEGRTLLQPPRGTGACTRRNGIFYTNNTCTEFVTCRDNNPAFERCAEGLVFDPQKKICAWSDEALREGCLPEDLLGFRCPNPKLSIEDAISQRVHLRFGDHDRFADPKDCRYFFMCLRTGHPRRAGCGQGQVFDRSVGICRPAKEVAECADYYGAATPPANKAIGVARGPASQAQAVSGRLARIEDDINRQFEEARRRLQPSQRLIKKRSSPEPEPEPE